MCHFKKTKNIYYVNLNEKGLNDNKHFSQTLKLLHSDRTKLFAKTTLVIIILKDDNIEDEIVNDDVKVAHVLNIFLNAMKNLEISEFNEAVTLADDISHSHIQLYKSS